MPSTSVVVSVLPFNVREPLFPEMRATDALTSRLISPLMLMTINPAPGTQWLEIPPTTQSQLFALPQFPVVVFQLAKFWAVAQQANSRRASGQRAALPLTKSLLCPILVSLRSRRIWPLHSRLRYTRKAGENLVTRMGFFLAGPPGTRIGPGMGPSPPTA